MQACLAVIRLHAQLGHQRLEQVLGRLQLRHGRLRAANLGGDEPAGGCECTMMGWVGRRARCVQARSRHSRRLLACVRVRVRLCVCAWGQARYTHLSVASSSVASPTSSGRMSSVMWTFIWSSSRGHRQGPSRLYLLCSPGARQHRNENASVRAASVNFAIASSEALHKMEPTCERENRVRVHTLHTPTD